MIKQFYLTHRCNPNTYNHAGQSEAGRNGNEGILQIPQYSTSEASTSDGFVSYPEHLLGGGSFSSSDMQSAYSSAG